MIEFLTAFNSTEIASLVAAFFAAGLGGFVIYKISLKAPELKASVPPPELETSQSKPDGNRTQPSTPLVQPKAPVEEATMQKALAATRRGLFDRLKNVFGVQTDLDDAIKEQLEEILYTSDFGPTTVEHLMNLIQEKLPKQIDFETVRTLLKTEISGMMEPVQNSSDSKGLDGLDDQFSDGPKPRIWMIVGVNGVGKTTTIGKLASLLAQKGHRVLVAAGDTFRAAASGQLKVWSERAAVEIFSPEGNAKPSGVAFDACQKAVNEKFDVVLLDTAGRLHTQVNLMEELKKIKRVIEKVIPEAPHQVLLVLDANSGQNALVQAKEFNEAIQVNGVILTKLDGTAKGGVAVGLNHELHLPIKAVGIGEKVNDLKPFSTREFVDSIL